VLKLKFNEDIESTFSNAAVADGNGAAVSKERAKVDPSNPRVLTVAVPKRSSGSYAVHWAVMTHDGHKTKGDYSSR
jgi:copper resistance protein C